MANADSLAMSPATAPVSVPGTPSGRAPASATAAAKPPRDLRLDFFRGLALWFIFVDHIPSSSIGQITFRNFGFSDATEIFVFISGYTAAIVYGAALDRGGFIFMTLQVLKRCWQLYAAHILLFVFFLAQISWVATRFGNASFIEELNITAFLDAPLESIFSALMLHYRPVNLDVLPMYIALLFVMPLLLVMARASRILTLLLSIALWLGVQQRQWAFPVYEGGDTWFFNPLGWQLMFVIGILCASLRGQNSPWLAWRPWLAGIAVLYLLFAGIIAVGWRIPAIDRITEPLVGWWLYPIDKTNLGWARVVHFLATAYLVGHFVRPESRFLSWHITQPVIRCGQHSLYIFCLGISLSFLAHFVLVEFGRSWPMQLTVVIGGLVVMTALAYHLHWYRIRTTAGKPGAGKGAGRQPAPPAPAEAAPVAGHPPANTPDAPAASQQHRG